MSLHETTTLASFDRVDQNMPISDLDVSTVAKAVGTRERFASAHDHAFFHRVFDTPHSIYLARTGRAGLTGNKSVLDAGCGYGQWSLALAETNARVFSLDIDPLRIGMLRKIDSILKFGRISPSVGRLEQLPFPDNSFDLVFCYSAVYFGDWRKAVTEIVRVTRRNGSIYINSNAIGWYLKCLLSTNHRSEFRSDSFRKMALKALVMSSASWLRLVNLDTYQSIISSRMLCNELRKSGASIEEVTGDGGLGTDGLAEPLSFFESKNFGFESVYEVLARKG